MADEPDNTQREHIAEEHPDMPDDVIDGLAALAEINKVSGIEQDVDAGLGIQSETDGEDSQLPGK